MKSCLNFKQKNVKEDRTLSLYLRSLCLFPIFSRHFKMILPKNALDCFCPFVTKNFYSASSILADKIRLHWNAVFYCESSTSDAEIAKELRASVTNGEPERRSSHALFKGLAKY